MKLLLKRDTFYPAVTLGTLTCGPAVFQTLEDVVREVPGEPVENWKVQGQTAIPVGDYKLIIDFSQKFQHEMPHVLDVPGFTGIRIHKGNAPEDTEGCILVGMSRGADNCIHSSKIAFDHLFELLEEAYDLGKELSISVEGLS